MEGGGGQWWSLVAASLTAAVALWVARAGWRLHRRERRRSSLQMEPFPPEWETFLRRKMALYPLLPESERERLHYHARVLFEEKRFEPCGNLEEVTDEMALLICAQAALLLIGRPPAQHRFYPQLYSILLYPTTYHDGGRRTFGEDEEPETRLGESWLSGSVVLAWNSVEAGAAHRDDGLNVVLHEFAHQLDQEDGRGDGAPVLENPADYGDWARVFSHRYEELVERAREHRRTLLDPYGAEDPAEFFAVATEAFFERATRMEREMPDLYGELRDFYGLDPAEWFKQWDQQKRGRS